MGLEILAINDEEYQCAWIFNSFLSKKIEPFVCFELKTAQEELQRKTYDAVLIDLSTLHSKAESRGSRQREDISIIEYLRKEKPDTAIIILTNQLYTRINPEIIQKSDGTINSLETTIDRNLVIKVTEIIERKRNSPTSKKQHYDTLSNGLGYDPENFRKRTGD